MGNPRSTRQRKRRAAGLHPHELAFLTGEPQPEQSVFGDLAIRCIPPNDGELARRLELVERYAHMIPPERAPIVERWVEYWRRERISPDSVGENFIHAR